jgi:hypothetical protein
VAAGRRNRARRGPLTPAGAERLRRAAIANRPWQYATGPRTAAGKAKSSANGLARARGPESARAARREVADLRGLSAAMAQARRALAGGAREGRGADG